MYTVDRIGEEGVAKENAAKGCVIDYMRAKEIVATISEDENERKILMGRATRKAERELNRNWLHIQAVAEELLSRQTLTEEEILEVMAKTAR